MLGPFLCLDNQKEPICIGSAEHAPRHSESFPGQPCAQAGTHTPQQTDVATSTTTEGLVVMGPRLRGTTTVWFVPRILELEGFRGDDSSSFQYAQINSSTPTTISTMPNASRGVVACLNA